MQPARLNGSTFSGPAALSSLTGLGTKEICTAIRTHFGNIRIKAIFKPQIEWFLQTCKLRLNHIAFDRSYKRDDKGMWQPVKGPTLERWAKENQIPDILYLINVSEHYLVLLNNRICCTQFDGIEDLCESRYLRCHVNELWTVQGTAEINWVQELCGTQPKVRTPSERATLNYYKRTYLLEIIDTIDDCNVAWPDHLIKTIFKGDDPFCQSNCFSSHAEAIAAIEEVLTKYNLPKKPAQKS